MELYVGLMSGTSVDGIDAVVVDFAQPKPILRAAYYHPYSDDFRKNIFALLTPGDNEIDRLGALDVALAYEFASSVQTLLQSKHFHSQDVIAIGSHGQTIRHRPKGKYCFSMQIGDPNTLCALTGITTVADFRRKDIAFGGQGAPLVPAFHAEWLRDTLHDRAVVNLGGIANVTILPKQGSQPVIGFDTGPGNTLLDAWIYHHQQQRHDKNGDWGREGNTAPDLLASCLADPYFQLTGPKSTGPEYFNLPWLQTHLQAQIFRPIDVQSTLVELTAQTIMDGIRHHLKSGEIILCGGGTHNSYLVDRLRHLANPAFMVTTTHAFGIDPDWVEAAAFAWLAKQTLHGHTGNLPTVTGAQKPTILGAIYYADKN